VVRGYSGFGFSLLAITAISPVLPPVQIVPSIFLMEVAASLHLLPGVWTDIEWRALRYLAVGCCLGTPCGVYALAHAPVLPMRLALAVFVLAAAWALGKGRLLKQMPGSAATVATGAASGLFNGAFGMGGPPVVLFFFSAPMGLAAGRASLIAFFFFTDVIGLAWQGANGLIQLATVVRAALFLPPLAAGLWLGSRSFKGTDPSTFRRWVLRILMTLALITGGEAIFKML
jgi:hypothetical protein